MEYKIKSMVVGFRLSRWESELNDFDELCTEFNAQVSKAYPSQIFVISSKLSLKASYDDKFLILSYLLSYYYDGDEITKIERNAFMEEFKAKIKQLISEQLSKKDINFQELAS